MSDNLIFGEPHLLADFNVPMANGGYQDERIGEGGGPSSAETTIENMFAGWSAPRLTNMGDQWTAYMADGFVFHDNDENGYYDILERPDDYGVFRFDPETGCWRYRGYEDIDL